MTYLDLLIGFSLIMLVFASGVSVVQTLLKRILAIKGAAITAPLRDEITRAYAAEGLEMDKAAHAAMDACALALGERGSALGGALRTTPIAGARAVLAHMRELGAKGLDDAGKAAWSRAIDKVGDDWDRVAGRLSTSYEQRTRRWVVGLSLAAAFLFNLDAIRILNVLSVSPDMRGKLVQIAEQVHEKGHGAATPAATDGDLGAAFSALSDWQKGNLAALAGAGLPVGWSKMALRVVDDTPKEQGRRVRHDCLAGEACPGETAWLATVEMWLLRLFGLLVGGGLVAQGAPFWYSVVDTVLGLKKKAAPVADAYGADLSRTVGDAETRLRKVVAEAEAWSKALAATERPGPRPQA